MVGFVIDVYCRQKDSRKSVFEPRLQSRLLCADEFDLTSKLNVLLLKSTAQRICVLKWNIETLTFDTIDTFFPTSWRADHNYTEPDPFFGRPGTKSFQATLEGRAVRL